MTGELNIEGAVFKRTKDGRLFYNSLKLGWVDTDTLRTVTKDSMATLFYDENLILMGATYGKA